QSLFASLGAALVGSAGDPAIARHRSAIAERAIESLVNQPVGGVDADALEPGQHQQHQMGARSRRLLEPLLAGALDLLDLLLDELEASQVAAQFGERVGRN